MIINAFTSVLYRNYTRVNEYIQSSVLQNVLYVPLLTIPCAPPMVKRSLMSVKWRGMDVSEWLFSHFSPTPIWLLFYAGGETHVEYKIIYNIFYMFQIKDGSHGFTYWSMHWRR